MNLLSPEESDLNPRGLPAAGPMPGTEGQDGSLSQLKSRLRIPLWPLLALLGLLILLPEFYLWVRKA